MKILKFDATKILKNNNFRENKNICDIYFEIAQMAMTRFYHAYPFHSLFEGASWFETDANEFFQRTLIVWADCLMTWEMNNVDKALEAINYIIKLGILPTLGIFRSAYYGEFGSCQVEEYQLYIFYTYRELTNRNTEYLSFEDWQKQEKFNTVKKMQN